MFKKFLTLPIIACFILNSLGPICPVTCAAQEALYLPAPGMMVNLSPAYEPVIIKGLTVHKDNPFLFDFIVDVGQDRISGEPLKKEGEKLIKYFLASLAIPDKDVWVNLSPYENSKIIPEVLGQTDMGRDLLEQDYILKQITASLIYPEKQLGKKFWDSVYTKAKEMYGTTQIPVNTFNKVWIMADRAELFEHNQTAFVVDSHLKVMLEEDYLALTKHQSRNNPTHSIASQVVRQIILPELEKEVNRGKNFANLRQICNSLILANWYKKNLKQALLNQVYSNQSKVKGIDLSDLKVKQRIYDQYLKAYKKGVFNYIKDDINTVQGSTIPRKYFSGGFVEGAKVVSPAMTTDPVMFMGSLPKDSKRLINILTLASLVDTGASANRNAAMINQRVQQLVDQIKQTGIYKEMDFRELDKRASEFAQERFSNHFSPDDFRVIVELLNNNDKEYAFCRDFIVRVIGFVPLQAEAFIDILRERVLPQTGDPNVWVKGSIIRVLSRLALRYPALRERIIPILKTPHLGVSDGLRARTVEELEGHVSKAMMTLQDASNAVYAPATNIPSVVETVQELFSRKFSSSFTREEQNIYGEYIQGGDPLVLRDRMLKLMPNISEHPLIVEKIPSGLTPEARNRLIVQNLLDLAWVFAAEFPLHSEARNRAIENIRDHGAHYPTALTREKSELLAERWKLLNSLSPSGYKLAAINLMLKSKSILNQVASIPAEEMTKPWQVTADDGWSADEILRQSEELGVEHRLTRQELDSYLNGNFPVLRRMWAFPDNQGTLDMAWIKAKYHLRNSIKELFSNIKHLDSVSFYDNHHALTPQEKQNVINDANLLFERWRVQMQLQIEETTLEGYNRERLVHLGDLEVLPDPQQRVEFDHPSQVLDLLKSSAFEYVNSDGLVRPNLLALDVDFINALNQIQRLTPKQLEGFSAYLIDKSINHHPGSYEDTEKAVQVLRTKQVYLSLLLNHNRAMMTIQEASIAENAPATNKIEIVTYVSNILEVKFKFNREVIALCQQYIQGGNPIPLRTKMLEMLASISNAETYWMFTQDIQVSMSKEKRNIIIAQNILDFSWLMAAEYIFDKYKRSHAEDIIGAKYDGDASYRETQRKRRFLVHRWALLDGGVTGSESKLALINQDLKVMAVVTQAEPISPEQIAGPWQVAIDDRRANDIVRQSENKLSRDQLDNYLQGKIPRIERLWTLPDNQRTLDAAWIKAKHRLSNSVGQLSNGLDNLNNISLHDESNRMLSEEQKMNVIRDGKLLWARWQVQLQLHSEETTLDRYTQDRLVQVNYLEDRGKPEQRVEFEHPRQISDLLKQFEIVNSEGLAIANFHFFKPQFIIALQEKLRQSQRPELTPVQLEAFRKYLESKSEIHFTSNYEDTQRAILALKTKQLYLGLLLNQNRAMTTPVSRRTLFKAAAVAAAGFLTRRVGAAPEIFEHSRKDRLRILREGEGDREEQDMFLEQDFNDRGTKILQDAKDRMNKGASFNEVKPALVAVLRKMRDEVVASWQMRKKIVVGEYKSLLGPLSDSQLKDVQAFEDKINEEIATAVALIDVESSTFEDLQSSMHALNRVYPHTLQYQSSDLENARPTTQPASKNPNNKAMSTSSKQGQRLLKAVAIGLGALSMGRGVANTQANPPARVINVREFGAKGDGSDDTKHFQDAIDATPAGGVLVIPNGTYEITTPVQLKSGITLKGSGEKTIIYMPAHTNDNVTSVFYTPHQSGAEQTKNVHISDLSLRSELKTPGEGYWKGLETVPGTNKKEPTKDSNVIFVDVQGVDGFYIDRVSMDNGHYGIKISNLPNQNIFVNHVNIEHTATPVYISHAKNVHFENSILDSKMFLGTDHHLHSVYISEDVQDVHFQDVTFSNTAGAGIHIYRSEGKPAGKIYMDKVKFVNCGNALVVFDNDGEIKLTNFEAIDLKRNFFVYHNAQGVEISNGRVLGTGNHIVLTEDDKVNKSGNNVINDTSFDAFGATADNEGSALLMTGKEFSFSNLRVSKIPQKVGLFAEGDVPASGNGSSDLRGNRVIYQNREVIVNQNKSTKASKPNHAMAHEIRGGIDLNTSNGMQWKINKDGNGVEMNINPAMIARIQREGVNWLSPIILRISPVSNVWSLAGLRSPKG